MSPTLPAVAALVAQFRKVESGLRETILEPALTEGQIRKLYDDLPQHEAFGVFTSEGVQPDDLVPVLGQSTADLYSTFMYLTIK